MNQQGRKKGFEAILINNVQFIRAIFYSFFDVKKVEFSSIVGQNRDFQFPDFNDVRLTEIFGRFFQKILKSVITNR